MCLTCFNGGCISGGHAKSHARLNPGHHLTLRISRTPKANQPGVTAPEKVTKLAIGVQGGVQAPGNIEYDIHSSVHCWACGDGVEVDRNASEALASLVQGVLDADSVSHTEETKSWELERNSCKHCEEGGLKQVDNPPTLAAKGLAKCSSCDLTDNLWLCLTCGTLSCGRKNFDGSGGNGHALAHFDATSHPMAAKMGTITPEGEGDVHCYSCDDEVVDKLLSKHLAHFGIAVSDQVKTAKNMAELELEQNLNRKWWSSVTEAGEKLVNRYGPGFTGLENLGNSCYMASILQVLFDLPPFYAAYYTPSSPHTHSCTNAPHAKCFRCQITKIADGLLSGRYSKTPDAPALPPPPSPSRSGSAPVPPPAPKDKDGEPPSADVHNSVAPRMLKALIGRDHPEFSTFKQQDAQEFFEYFMEQLHRHERASELPGPDPSRIFEFSLEQRLQCTTCKKVRYSNERPLYAAVPVPLDANVDKDVTISLDECLKTWGAQEQIADFSCPSCGKATVAAKNYAFATFPDFLVLQVRRFVFSEWVPKKLENEVTVDPNGIVDLSAFRGSGKKADEEELPAGSAAPPVPLAPVDEVLLTQLMTMGFGRVRCEKALRATGGNNVEAGMNWLLEHMDDPNLDVPDVPAPPSGAGAAASANEPSAEALTNLQAMGFTEEQSRAALKETSNNVERAVDWLFSHADDPVAVANALSGGAAPAPPAGGAAGSTPAGPTAGLKDGPGKYRIRSFVTHRGRSTAMGHYVAHIRKGDKWVLYNDRHVAELKDETPAPVGKSYMIILERV